MKHVAAVVFASFVLGCSSSQTGETTPESSSSGSAVVEVPKPADTGPSVTPEPTSTASAPPPADSAQAPPKDPEAPAGRLAFTACTDVDRKAKGCTKEMRPVCGEVNTGIVCVRAPCPSTMRQNFSNPCSACVEPKTRGYWPMACENMAKPESSAF